MIFIGDVATNKYNPDHPVNTVEILYMDDEELQYILAKYELEQFIVDFPLYKEYKSKKGMVYKLFSLKNDRILELISKKLFNKKRGTTIANPFINFVFDCCRVIKVHARFSEWQDRVKSYTYLADNYIVDLVTLDSKYDRYIDRYFKMLKQFKDCQQYTKYYPFRYKPFHVNISHNDLLEIVTTVAIERSPLFLIMKDTKENETYSEAAFDKLSYQDKLYAAFECLYIDVLNEFVIPQIRNAKLSPSDEAVENMFEKAIMWRASQVDDGWFGHFMVNNYEVLLQDYDKGFYRAFCNQLRKGDLVILPKDNVDLFTSRNEIY